MIGLSLRNIDSTYPVQEGGAELHHYLPQLIAYLDCVQAAAAPDTHVLLGGTGFSMMPEAFLEGRPAAWHGLVGPAESALVGAVEAIAAGEPVARLERAQGGEAMGRLQNRELLARYLELPIGEGTFGVRSKVGCGSACGYCPYPLINGPGQRLKDPRAVLEEIGLLAEVHGGARYPCASCSPMIFSTALWSTPRRWWRPCGARGSSLTPGTPTWTPPRSTASSWS